MRVMTPKEVRTAMALAKDLHQGQIDLPPEIVKINERITQAKRNALQFIVIFRMVDMSLVQEAVELMLEKDRPYAKWVARETSAMTF